MILTLFLQLVPFMQCSVLVKQFMFTRKTKRDTLKTYHSLRFRTLIDKTRGTEKPKSFSPLDSAGQFNTHCKSITGIFEVLKLTVTEQT